MQFVPRDAQKRILEYSGGYMGVSAVPGSGKTFTLSMLAAKLVTDLAPSPVFSEREVLVVTFSNSAVQNFQSRIASILSEREGLLPGVGYRVRTLHGLAHDIVRERPSLAGLSEKFVIIDERTSEEIVRDSVHTYLRIHPDALSAYIASDFLRSGRSISSTLEKDAAKIANRFISTIKDERFNVQRLERTLEQQSGSYPLLVFGLQVYTDYQKSLEMRGAVDFSDLIALALQVLESDSDFLNRLQDRWPYVLEDEAQDSSHLQEQLLRMLTARHKNWVRVGDPNQAINTTFTTANTRFLRQFIEQNQVESQELPDSGRCTVPIIEQANYLIDWSRQEHPYLDPADALVMPHIQPTAPDDPQQNPPANEAEVHLYPVAMSPQKESEVLVKSLRRWLVKNEEENLGRTVAILAPTNNRVLHIAEELKNEGIPIDDSLMRTPNQVRETINALGVLLTYLARPDTSNQLNEVWLQTWWPHKGQRVAVEHLLRSQSTAEDSSVHSKPLAPPDVDIPEPVRLFAEALRKLRQPEDFLFPANTEWLNHLPWVDDADGFRDIVSEFRTDMVRWTQASTLPIAEMILTIGNELFDEPAHLAIAHHVAVVLSKLAHENEDWQLPELAREMRQLASNRRYMPNFSSDSEGYVAKPGVVTLASMHGAKGLEWDRVYLTAVSTYDYPSGSDEDNYYSELYYAREKLNLEAEALLQLRQLNMGTLDEYVEGAATLQARHETAAERLRLLYVGITRARRDLIITYNTGRYPDRNPQQPALAFQALMDHLEPVS